MAAGKCSFSIKRLFFMMLLLVLVAGVCSGCGEDKPVLIGFSGPLKGKYADLGVQGRNGARLALEMVNARGGVDGRPLAMVVHNDNGSVEDALKADERMMGQGVVAVIGHFLSVQSLAAVDKFADSPLILISPTTSTPLLSGLKDNFFRVMPSNENWAAALASFAASEMGAPSVLMVMDADNKGYTATFCEAFAHRYAQLGGEASGEFHFFSNSKGWEQAVVDRIAANKPQALLVAASASDAASLARRIRLAGETLPIMITPSSYTKELVALAGSAVEGVITSMSYDENSEATEFLAFKNAYHNRFGTDPQFAAAFAYDAILALADALDRTGGKSTGLAKALAEVKDIPGSMGTFTLDENGDVNRTHFIVTVRNRALKTLSRVQE